jgi:response regulator of citrate/malate metabolism
MIRTLVVDDDYRVAAVHAAGIDRVDGFGCVGQAHSRAEAVDLVERSAPDLVLIDIYLPDGNGLDLVAELAELRESSRPDVIVVTAARDVATVRRAMQSGALHYLVKPFGFAALRDKLVAYRRLREHLDDVDVADQADVDALYGLLHAPVSTRAALPPTMATVLEALQGAQDASAAEVAQRLGLSRATAQRYLARLVDKGMAELSMRYGSTGRPEHRYRRRPGA